MIKAIFFDYDGVLTTDKTGSLTTNRYLSTVSGVEYESVRKAFAKYNPDLLVGKVTHTDIWDAACKAMRCKVDFSLLEEAFQSTPANAAMFALARSLKPAYSLGIITDNKRDRIDSLKKSQGLDALFNPIIVSAEFGSGKDSTAVFEHALRCVGIGPEESIFIDNNRENLIAPSALGMGTIFHDDEKNDVEKLIETLRNEFNILELQ
ncbi:haloacid dehalogenase [Burkholderia cepacia]|uniref:HAD family hydrolase n=1 Tax=Burkholderia cepacia TaxID=292 RepID=UPI000755F953|nr:HAD family hydrolase [Burkholderia cepacia]KVA49878.1 haloacid dehalogenase [Burkholderia cepacia]KVA57275.1 haloacid dehalogenase [Burkholderia cepacia]KVA76922.1 haloacid dehalogenase [Burkholderia cepacia]KVA95152.1 haloacid dehalogenase [Burkholderia cepacia]KVA97551.1 haloacid dehalogenase [Burkholderia cepacia]